jgi:hypothetical protein
VAVGPTWARQEHQENQEDVAYLFRPRAHAENVQSMVLIVGLQRAEEIEDEVEEASVPGTKWIQSKLQGRGEKLKEEGLGRERVSSSSSPWRWSWWCYGRGQGR